MGRDIIMSVTDFEGFPAEASIFRSTMQTQTNPFSQDIAGDGDSSIHLNGEVVPVERRDIWYYPSELNDDLKGVDLPQHIIDEALACSWEYTRSVIPTYTNWGRYISWVRIVVVGIIAEFRGDLVDVSCTDDVLGYNVQALVDGCFEGTAGHALMGRELRSYLLSTADKASPVRRNGELFRRYANSLAYSPSDWFRLRDCDGLIRFTAAAALASNDFDDMWFSEDEWNALAELPAVLYDSVAFYKHRAEAETNNTFAYFPPDLRVEYFRRCREVLWSLDAAWAHSPAHLCVVNFLRLFGGPIKLMMRRYRFVEEGLTIGKSETKRVVEQTREHFKLWNRLDSNNGARGPVDVERYEAVLSRKDKLLFPGQAEMLQREPDRSCGKCLYKGSYGTRDLGEFGGVQLCDNCREKWREYADGVITRAAKAFPILLARRS